MFFHALLVLLLNPAAPGVTADSAVRRWGSEGHRMVGAAAAAALPESMPSFFRAAADQLSYLNPEPDRWKAREERDLDPAMNSAHSSEHYINFEGIPASVFSAPHRFAYLDSLKSHGFDIPGPGLLPFRILELTQRLRVGFREWRAATDPREREWIEQRIINDAGILGHFVADGSNPAHTTVHHNGWVGDNPRGYATDDRFHSRFESAFVRAQIGPEHVREKLGRDAEAFPELRPAIFAYLQTSNSLVQQLYEIDLRSPFSETNTNRENREFAAERLAAGAEMLRDLWWTAWVTSGDASPRELKP
ncbi:hypothetical protein BH23GEM6_BH23GEM6_01780 [soil metagenome]